MAPEVDTNFAAIESSAAHNLEGKELEGGWVVSEKIQRKTHSTGSFFSVCYKVIRGDEVAFLKAFDFARFFSMLRNEGKSVIDTMKYMTEAFSYERDLSQYCTSHHVTKVSIAKQSGELQVSGYGMVDAVPYLIFDMADGDIRDLIAFNGRMDNALLFKSLHSVAVGIKQLHIIGVSHNDLKPSNVLVFTDSHKIGDLGSSMCATIPGPHNDRDFAGDWSYAPPELFYGYIIPDATERSILVDLYLLGSMFAFYFTGCSMSALLMDNLPDQFRVGVWTGTFDEVKHYLVDAFARALSQLSNSIDEKFRDDVITIVEKLCYPIPERRGFGFPQIKPSAKYTVEQLVSRLDVLLKRAELSV